MAPVVIGKIYDLTSIKIALESLPFVLLVGAILFWLGSRKYAADMNKVAKIQLVAEG
jgi:hypothetical protein